MTAEGVKAANRQTALDGARRWLATRADDSVSMMPEDCHLLERVYNKRRAKSYMILEVV